jgi:aminoglycoside phosphotransferase (APT) family kinase protein
VNLPDHTPLTPEVVRAIRDRHRLGDRAIAPLPNPGIINAVYALGDDLVLRVPRNHPAHATQARHEALAIPAARMAGVRTPALVAYDDALDLLPVPYLVVERVEGVALGAIDMDPAAAVDAWRAVGADLARLHVGVPTDSPSAAIDPAELAPDPDGSIERRAREGWFSTVEAAWLQAWVDRLRPLARPPAVPRLSHGDVQSTNVMVDAAGPAYRALIDWGCAQWSDPAIDLLGMPLRCVPAVLAGHRTVAPFDDDETAEARAVWHHLATILWLLPRGAAPDASWGEQPTAMLMDLLRFFLETGDERWRSLSPPRGVLEH